MPLMPHISGAVRFSDSGSELSLSGEMLVPTPGRGDNFRQTRDIRPTVEFVPRFSGIAYENCRIAATSTSHHNRNFSPRDLADCIDHLAYGKAPAVSQIIGLPLQPLLERLQRRDVSICQIRHMDIVTDAGAI